MPTSVKRMLADANAAVPRIGREDAAALIASGDVLVVDVRDAPELQASGKVAGAVHVSRGMLEFRADPDSPYHDQAFNPPSSPSFRHSSKKRFYTCSTGPPFLAQSSNAPRFRTSR